MISGIPLVLGLGTRTSDPYVFVVFWGPNRVGATMESSYRIICPPLHGPTIHSIDCSLCQKGSYKVGGRGVGA